MGQRIEFEARQNVLRVPAWGAFRFQFNLFMFF